MKKSEIRKDYLLERYVIISPARSQRPHQLIEPTVVSTPGFSPFTPEHLKGSKIIDSLGNGKNKVAVLKNKFPAVSLNNPKAYGVQEVIIDTPDPSLSLVDAGVPQIKRVLEMYARRTRALEKNKRLQYILCFKNEGAKAGASLQHAHSQVFATDILPPDTAEAALIRDAYNDKVGRCFYADLITKEMKTARRVYEDANVAVFTPYASFYHYEVWIFSKREVGSIARLTSRELSSLAQSLYTILKLLQKLGLAYNFFCHQIVTDRREHFCLKVEPRDSVWAGVELGSGLVINSVTPEAAADLYRKEFKKL